MRHIAPAAAIGALVLATAAAQDIRVRHGSWPRAFATDTGRGRIVAVGADGDTQEWDGSRWIRRPVRSPAGGPGVSRLVYDPVARRTLAVVSNLQYETWDFDGAAWRAHGTTPAGNGSYDDPVATFDHARGRPLLLTRSVLSATFVSHTWEWTGSNWLHLQPATQPPGRNRSAMVFDVSRGRAVLFGGVGYGGPLDDTWEWDGSNWQQRQFAVKPSARYGPAMGYDASRQRIVLFGGAGAYMFGDVWEYDGSSWQQQSPTGPTPTPRYQASLVDDPASSELLLIGGVVDGLLETRDCFRWNGVHWQPHPGLPVMLTSRSAVACAQEASTGGTLMFGGRVGPAGTATNETWRWDGQAWSFVTTTTAPPSRFSAAMWSDFLGVFVFGGRADDMSMSPFADTWRWTGASWVAVPTNVTPPPRSHSPIAYDLARGRAVLFGGHGASGLLDDTWTFDGGTWRQENPAPVPAARKEHGLADDMLRSRVVLFGGNNQSGLLLDTLEWDGTTWIPMTPAARPPATRTASMDFDLQRRRVVLVQSDANGVRVFDYDGVSWTPIALATDYELLGQDHTVVHRLQARRLEVFTGRAVLELSHAPAIAEPFGSGCGSDPPALAARSLPRIGASDFGLEVARAPAGAPVGIAGGTAISSIAIGPCTQQVSPILASVFLLANAGGFASLDVAIPGNPALLGTTLFFQAAALDATAPAGFTTTAGLRVVVGD